MKIKSLMYVLMGTMLVTTSCSDNELEKGNDGSGTVDPVNASTLVNVYSDKSGSEASLLVGDVLVKDSRTLTLNVPAACEKVYMKYNTVSGTEATKEFALSPVSRGVDQSTGFNFETNRLASVTLALPEDAVQPTNETDQGYLFYHNTGVVMFEDGWPIQLDSWYDEDFNDVVFEYDLKVTECHSQQMMETVGGKEELLLTLDVRAVGEPDTLILYHKTVCVWSMGCFLLKKSDCISVQNPLAATSPSVASASLWLYCSAVFSKKASV